MATINGTNGNDLLEGGVADDTINGFDGNDILIGNNGHDFLDGGRGADILNGGIGADSYIIDNINDQIIDDENDGNGDEIQSSITYTLSGTTPGSIQSLSLFGLDYIDGYGNNFDNQIAGGWFDNKLIGAGGDDSIDGSHGNDYLEGGAGNDTLIGGTHLDEITSRYIYASIDNQIKVNGILPFGGNPPGVGIPYNGITRPVTENTGDLVSVNGEFFIVNGSSDPSLTKVKDLQSEQFTHIDIPGWNLDDSDAVPAIASSGNYIFMLSESGSSDQILRYNISSSTVNVFAEAEAYIDLAGGLDSFIYSLADNNTVTKYDPASGVVLGEITLGVNAETDIIVFAVDASSSHIYAADTDGIVYKFNSSGVIMASETRSESYVDMDLSPEGIIALGMDTGFVALLDDSFDSVATFYFGVDADAYVTFGSHSSYGDTVSYRNTAGSVTINLLDGTATSIDGNDTIQEIENVDGSDHGDNITGDNSRNLLFGFNGSDTITGGGGNDTLDGGNGNDSLNGGTGIDAMTGGQGNDSYYIDNLDDKVIEKASEGTDTIFSKLSFALATDGHIENLTLIDDGTAFSGDGNHFNNILTGNASMNFLSGWAGNDTLSGMNGDDTLRGGRGVDLLQGGGGNDRLDGGFEVDLLSGGSGNDVYVIYRGDGAGTARNAAEEAQINEVNNEGIDTIESHVYSYVLPDNIQIENLLLAGDHALKGFGNGLNNQLTGNGRDNLLDGGGGNDVLLGQAGNDKLIGGSGNDVMNGGTGTDTLWGGSGADIFVLDNLDARDWVFDYSSSGSGDRIHLSLNVFNGIGTVGTDLNAWSFVTGTNPDAADADDHILYNTVTGSLYYDPDGNGGASMIQFASLSGAPGLNNTDIHIIA